MLSLYYERSDKKSAKQDRSYARTAQDIERKYSFGKTFADMLGLINDNRDKVDSVESELRNEITEQSTTLKRDTEQIVIQATETVKAEINGEIDDINGEIVTIKKDVEAKVDADGLSLAIKSEVAGGIALETGYTFNSNGLNITKSGEAMANLLDNTGMYVKKSGDDILVANKDGVTAKDLQAKGYLIIGDDNGRSRFEDYGINRTAVFWVGG